MRFQNIATNVWPAKDYYFLNGWILRFSDDYSNRANSLLPRDYYGTNVDEDIAIAEKIFTAYGRTPKFVINQYVKPKGLEEKLIIHGYQREPRILDVMSCEMAGITTSEGNYEVSINHSSRGEREWFDFLASNGDSIGENVIKRIAVPVIQFFSAFQDSKIIGTAFAVKDPQGYLFIANLMVDKDYRSKGIARTLISRTINWGKKQGAEVAWFQVDSRNNAALSLYSRMGFKRLYSYGYYSKKKS